MWRVGSDGGLRISKGRANNKKRGRAGTGGIYKKLIGGTPDRIHQGWRRGVSLLLRKRRSPRSALKAVSACSAPNTHTILAKVVTPLLKVRRAVLGYPGSNGTSELRRGSHAGIWVG